MAQFIWSNAFLVLAYEFMIAVQYTMLIVSMHNYFEMLHYW